MRLAIVAVLALVTGCGPGGPGGFAVLGDWTLTFFDLGDRGVSAALQYDDAREGCHVLPADFSATVDGEAVEVYRGGGYYGFWDAKHHCNWPSFLFDRPATLQQTTVVEMSCGGDHLLAELGQVGRSLGGQLVLAQGAQVHVGQAVRIALEAGFDRMEWSGAGEAFVEGAGQPATLTVAPPSPDGMLDVQLPATLPPGRTHVRIHPTNPPAILRCEGTDTCQWDDGVKLSVLLDVAFDVVE